ncbi:NAD dependent epimerase/dehydratase [Chiua virens]|nr:NAD dependent epimerase/dehydratase [Chiua virens]
MDLGLKGVHVLVTGASGGIGLETTKLYCYVPNPCAPYKPIFPTKLPSSTSSLPYPTATPGPVQVVVVNHAIAEAQYVPVVDISLAQWNRILTTNLTSTFLVCREYLKHLRQASTEAKDKAAIVLIGSTAGKYGEAGNADYAATKSAMMYGLTMTLKNEIVKIAPRGRVNCVAPGWVYTPRTEVRLKNPDIRYRALATMPLKKVGMPTDVANQIVIQSSSIASGHVTGQVLMVEGGMEGRLLNKPEDIQS